MKDLREIGNNLMEIASFLDELESPISKNAKKRINIALLESVKALKDIPVATEQCKVSVKDYCGNPVRCKNAAVVKGFCRNCYAKLKYTPSSGWCQGERKLVIYE